MKKHHIVTKSNALIEARYKLTLGEQKIILLLASMIKPNDEEFHKYRINIKDFMELLDIKNKNKYKQVEKITEDLMSKVITIYKAKSKLKISWLSSAEYFNGEGVVELCFDPKLKPFLLQLKDNFTSYQLVNVIQLKSYYSIRMYELLKQYERLKERSFEITELREILGIEGTQYPQYANFKQKVLNVAQKELEEKTDISFTFTEIKESRKATGVKFSIISKAKEKPINIDDAKSKKKFEAQTIKPSTLKNFEQEQIDYDEVMKVHSKLTVKDLFE